ncbi:transcription factor [Ganoderma sinense ZZ0214-1]|uniref:Transcription factor n=1 Tax=Ganoderma sinense ZZ0214-1 TaxID=1077348 RepID=A0A2G8RUR6_9APHY|nr:transcription factor [Ganoderma sinense ZZ0214-1]
MGRLRRSRTHHAQRDVHRAARTRARTRDLDQIQLIDLDPKNRAKLEAQPLDYEKPGLAQHYCVECAKYFETDHALRSHWKSKVHKRRCKALKEPAYTIEESERAAGLGKEGKRQTTTTADTPMEQGMTP